MDARTVEAGRGWQWIVEGFRIFREHPLVWIALVVVLVLVWLVSAMIPLLGTLAVSLLLPVLYAGLMTACRTADQGGEPEVAQLFGAFKTHATPLVTIGGVYLVGNIIAIGITFGIAGTAALPALMGKGAADPATMLAAARAMLLGLAVGMAVFMPILMAVWFAPMLVVFAGLAPLPALQLSFAACLRNMLPFLVYGVSGLALWILGSIPLLLGLIVVAPVLVCSIYASYKDIFPPAAGLPDAAA